MPTKMEINMIIGIGYKKQSGKDTVGKMIEEMLDVDVIIDSFASGLKESILNIFPTVKRRHMYGSDQDKNEIIPDLDGLYNTGRKAMQFFGTNCRDIQSNVFENQFLTRAKKQPGRVIICTDVRYPSEVDVFHAAGGITLKIVRDSIVSDDQHLSETSLDSYNKWDHIIENNGTLDELRVKVVDFRDIFITPSLERELS